MSSRFGEVSVIVSWPESVFVFPPRLYSPGLQKTWKWKIRGFIELLENKWGTQCEQRRPAKDCPLCAPPSPRPASCNLTFTLCTQFKPSTGKRPST